MKIQIAMFTLEPQLARPTELVNHCPFPPPSWKVPGWHTAAYQSSEEPGIIVDVVCVEPPLAVVVDLWSPAATMTTVMAPNSATATKAISLPEIGRRRADGGR